MKYSLVGVDGNAFSIMTYVISAMKQCGFTKKDCDGFVKNATSSNYDHLLCVSCEMIEKCNNVNYPPPKDDGLQVSTLKTLPDDPKKLCKLCLKFYNDGHYDNDPDMQPLYELLKKLYSILNKENRQ